MFYEHCYSAYLIDFGIVISVFLTTNVLHLSLKHYTPKLLSTEHSTIYTCNGEKYDSSKVSETGH